MPLRDITFMSRCSPSIFNDFNCSIAQLDVQDISGWTGLHWMLRCGRTKLTEAFMMRGVNLDIQNNTAKTRKDDAIKRVDIGANEVLSAPDPSARFGAVAAFDHILRSCR